MRLILTTVAAAALMTMAPGLAGRAFAHGGSYRGPAGEVPPDSREPSDPPPPPEGSGPGTPGDDPGGPTTGGGDVGGPSTGGGDGGGPPTGGSGGSGPPPSGGSGGGPSTGGAVGKKGPAKGPGYEDWTFWWNFNKDEILQLKSVVKSTQRGVRSGSTVHKFGRKQSGEQVVTATDAAITTEIVPILRAMLEQKDLNFDIQSAAALALSKIGDEAVIETLKKMARNEKSGPGYHKVVEESAALAFGLLQRNTPEVREFLIELVTDPKRNNSFVRPFAAISLGVLGGADAGAEAGGTSDQDGVVRATFLKIIAGKESGQDIKSACLVSLGLLGNEKAVPDLLYMLENGKVNPASVPGITNPEELSHTELAFVVQALGKIGKPGVAGKETVILDAITKIVDKEKNKFDKNVRRSAAIALGQIAPQAEPKVQEQILKTLKFVALEGPEAQEKNFAMISLGRIGATEGIDPKTQKQCIDTLKYCLDKAKPANLAQPFAALGLGLIGRRISLSGGAVDDELIRKPLREKFADEKEPRARGAYAISSGLVRDPLAVKALIETLKAGGDSRLRGYCALSLGMIGAPEGRDAIKAALSNPDRDLRVQTAVAAGLMGDASVIKELVAIIENPDASQYELGSAALGLGQIGDENSIKPLLAIVQDEKKFPDLTRALATVALGQIGDRRDLPVLTRVATDINYRAHVPSLAELLTIL